ncbi:hypothetical protein DVA85_28135, partial [Acinetobacter sp. RIT592]
MVVHSYEDVLQVCPIPYVWGKRISNKNGSFDYIIEGGNELLLKKLKMESEEEILNKDVCEILGISKDEIELFD